MLTMKEACFFADPMKALRQDMQEKAADEFVGRDGHDLLTVTMPIVLPAEAYRAILGIDEAVVGNGDAMRVAADAIEDLARRKTLRSLRRYKSEKNLAWARGGQPATDYALFYGVSRLGATLVVINIARPRSDRLAVILIRCWLRACGGEPDRASP